MPEEPRAPGPLRRRAGFAGLAALTLMAAVSVAEGMRNALARSQDFQWSGVRLLFARVDPWANSLHGDPLHQVHLSQIPNYLPVLYLLLVPLGLLPLRPAELVWGLLNIVFATASTLLAARLYRLGRMATAAAVLLVLASTAARQTIGNGQQGLLVLMLWTLALLPAALTDGRAALAGISYFKFNFAPPVAVYLWLRGGVRALLFSAVPNVAAVLVVWLWLTHGHNAHGILTLVMEPVQVSNGGGYFPSGGDPNLMDVMQVGLIHSFAPNTFFPDHVIAPWITAVTLAAGLLCTFAVLYAALRRRGRDDAGWTMALLAVLSFSMFKHHSYDSVVLAIPLCYAIARWRRTAAKVAVGAIAYVWYLQRGLDQELAGYAVWKYLFMIEFAVLLVLLAAVYRIGWMEPGERRVEA